VRTSPPEEVVRYYTAARSLRPETALNLALVLEQIKRGEEAEGIYRDLVARRPKSIDFLANCVLCLRSRGKPAEADAALAAALNDRPNDLSSQQYSSRIRDSLGTVSRSRGKRDDAIAEYREAIRLDPGNYLAHQNLGFVLSARNKRDEAVFEYFESIRRNPDNRTALSNLVNYLLYKSQPELAIGVCREMIRVRPDFAPAYHFLGMASNRARRPEAIAAGRIEAIKAWREAVRLDPTDRIDWYWLGVQLNVAGEFASSVDALKRAVEMAGEPIPSYAAAILARTQAYVELEPRLPAVLKGEVKPKDASETILYARMCKSLKRYATSVRFLDEAFADDPGLIEDQDCGRIYAAKCPVLAGSGQGNDDPPLDEPAPARLHSKGLNWLRDELAKGRTLVEKDPKLLPGPRGKQHSRADAFSELRERFVGGSSYRDLNEVRYPEGLAKLPDAEREKWQAFWAEVDALVKGAPGTKP
jgi:tetratricopeptide (TPR) repeat protein